MKYLDPKSLDEKVSPGASFYKYAVGGWLKKNDIPSDKSVWTTFHALREENTERLHVLVKDAKKKKKRSHYEQLAVDFFGSGMSARRNEQGIEPILSFFEEIDNISSEAAFMSYVGMCHEIGVSLFWNSFVEPDEKKTDTLALYYYQGGLTLPDREYYLSHDRAYVQARAAYIKHFVRMGKHLPLVRKASFMKSVLKVEKYLAKNARTKVELRDVHKQYNKHTQKKLTALTPEIDWKSYEEFAEISTPPYVIVGQPEYLKAVSDAMKKFTLKERKSYMLWRVFCTYAPCLSESIVTDHFQFFGKVLSGTKKLEPQWQRVIHSLDGHLGDATGQMYVEKHFPATAKKRADALVKDIKKTFAKRLDALTWMSPKTKEKAQEKLRAMRVKIGHTKKWEKYKGLTLTANDYVSNVMQVRMWQHRKEMKKIGKKPDPTQWEMTAATVNAYFHPLRNEIAFPAGILQPPFFYVDGDDAMNYGGIGTVIAHEITHGFDDSGSLFDKEGNIKKWWTASDKKKFDALTDRIIAQFDAFTALPGLQVQGALTAGENIADLGGLMIGLAAYKALPGDPNKKGKDGFTGVQRFFLSYALTEACKMRPQELRRRVVTDPHSPSIFRVHGPVVHMDDFYEAFDVTKGDKLFVPKEDRLVIW